MSVDIKIIAKAIQDAGTDADALEKVYKQYGTEIADLSEKAKVGAEVSEKGIFKQLKEAQDKLDAFEKKQKELEEQKQKENGEFKELAIKYQREKDELESKFKTASDIAEKWTTYEKTRREYLLSKLTDKDDKEEAEEMKSLDRLEKFVDRRLKQTNNNTGFNSNHTHKDTGGGTQSKYDFSKSNMKN